MNWRYRCRTAASASARNTAQRVRDVLSGRHHDVALARRSALRILVDDDNCDLAESLAQLLELTGNLTHVAYDGEEAVDAAQTFRPDVVLLDVGLPKLNGYDACRRMRQLPGGQELVIVAQTGWGQAQDHTRTREAGFDQHWVKPLDPDALMAMLANLQARRAATALRTD